MSITKPIVLDETGKEIVSALGTVAKRIEQLNAGQFYFVVNVEIESGSIVIAQRGATVREVISVDGEATVYLNSVGNWTINGTTPSGAVMLTEYISVTDVGIKTIAARFKGIYGAAWDKTSKQAWTRTDDAMTFDDPVPYVNDGVMIGADCSSPFDAIAPWSDMHIVHDPAAGDLVAIPKFWYKLENTATGMSVKIAEYPEEGYSVSPAHMDRGDGHGEREVVYVGRYHCASDYKSTSGVRPAASKTRAAFRAGIHTLGEDVWQCDYAMRMTIWLLYIVEFANWNSQEVIGYGCGNNSSAENMGYTDTMPYHTGTMQAKKTDYGLGTQYRYIEGLWDNVLDWLDGVYFSGADVYGILNPADYSDGANGTLLFQRPQASGYISDWQTADKDGFEWLMYPSGVAGEASAYVGDYCYFAAGGVVLCAGGSYYRSAVLGLFYLGGDVGSSYADGNIGSRLQKLP